MFKYVKPEHREAKILWSLVGVLLIVLGVAVTWKADKFLPKAWATTYTYDISGSIWWGDLCENHSTYVVAPNGTAVYLKIWHLDDSTEDYYSVTVYVQGTAGAFALDWNTSYDGPVQVQVHGTDIGDYVSNGFGEGKYGYCEGGSGHRTVGIGPAYSRIMPTFLIKCGDLKNQQTGESINQNFTIAIACTVPGTGGGSHSNSTTKTMTYNAMGNPFKYSMTSWKPSNPAPGVEGNNTWRDIDGDVTVTAYVWGTLPTGYSSVHHYDPAGNAEPPCDENLWYDDWTAIYLNPN